MTQLDHKRRQVLTRGTVIPAHPLALTAERRLDERRQRALYALLHRRRRRRPGGRRAHDAVRHPRPGSRAVRAGARTGRRGNGPRRRAATAEPLVRDRAESAARPQQAVREARLLAICGYHAGLLSLAALQERRTTQLIAHCRRGGRGHSRRRLLPPAGRRRPRAARISFWRRFAEIENVVAIKIAPFNRYQTLDVVRAVAESGRETSPSTPATTTTSCSTC